MKLSLTDRLARYCRINPGWIASGHLQRLALEKGYTAQNAGRRLRELVEEGVLEVEYRKPRNHAYYRAVPQTHVVQEVVVEGNVARVISKTISA